MTNTPSNNKPAARKAAPKAKATNVVEIAPKAAARSRKAKPATMTSAELEVAADQLAADVAQLAAETKAAKTSARKARKTAEPKPSNAPAAGGKLTDEQADVLAQLHGQMVNATAAFEAAVVGLLNAGASPTHVGNAVGLGNSSIRRIGWRAGWSS